MEWIELFFAAKEFLVAMIAWFVTIILWGDTIDPRNVDRKPSNEVIVWLMIITIFTGIITWELVHKILLLDFERLF